MHEFGNAQDVLVADEIPPPRAEDLAVDCVDLAGRRRIAGPGDTLVADWVILGIAAGALGLPDETLARGSYPVPSARPSRSASAVPSTKRRPASRTN
jgi:hypothetical protein